MNSQNPSRINWRCSKKNTKKNIVTFKIKMWSLSKKSERKLEGVMNCRRILISWREKKKKHQKRSQKKSRNRGNSPQPNSKKTQGGWSQIISKLNRSIPSQCQNTKNTAKNLPSKKSTKSLCQIQSKFRKKLIKSLYRVKFT